MNYFLASFYDAIYIYINALNKTIEDKNDINDIPNLLKYIWGKKFEGKIYFN